MTQEKGLKNGNVRNVKHKLIGMNCKNEKHVPGKCVTFFTF